MNTNRYPQTMVPPVPPPGGYNIAYGRQQRGASQATTLHLMQQQQQQQQQQNLNQQQHYQNSQLSSVHQQQHSFGSNSISIGNHLQSTKSQQNLASILGATNHGQTSQQQEQANTSNQFSTMMRYPPQCLPPLPFGDAKTQQRSQLIFTDRLMQQQLPVVEQHHTLNQQLADDPYYASPYSLEVGVNSLHSHRAPSSTQGLSLRLDRPNSQSLSAKPSKWRYLYKGDFHTRARNFLFRYQLLIRCLLLLLLLSSSLVFIIKFTLFPSSPIVSSSSASSIASQQMMLPSSTSATLNQQHMHQIANPSSMITQVDQMMDSHWLGSRNTPNSNMFQQQQNLQHQDLLKSKLVVGEFVITSQNYSHSPSQRNMLAERIIKMVSGDINRIIIEIIVIIMRNA